MINRLTSELNFAQKFGGRNCLLSGVGVLSCFKEDSRLPRYAQQVIDHRFQRRSEQAVAFLCFRERLAGWKTIGLIVGSIAVALLNR